MSFFEAILLGLVQGITEFLPVSSSGHLIILEQLLDIKTDAGVLFEVMRHMGTLIAVCTVFWEDLKRMFRETLRIGSDLIFNLKVFLRNKIHDREEERYKKILHNNYRKLVMMIVISSVPTGILGYLLKGIVEAVSSSLLAAGLGMLITAILLLVVDYWDFGDKIPKDMKSSQAFMIGICQGISVFPGISRSGITITSGLLCGLRKSFAVKYSFLISIPAILGAMLLELQDFATFSINFQTGAIYVSGMIVAAITGYFAIRMLLAVVQRRKFKIFAGYCMIVGVGAIVCDFIL